MQTETALLTQSKRRCCLCFFHYGDGHVKHGQIAHLDRDPGNASEDNLAYLCLDHHREYDSKDPLTKGLTVNEVSQARDELYNAVDQGEIGEHAAHRNATVVIKIACTLEDFSPQDQDALLRDFGDILMRTGSITVNAKRPGCTELEITLTPEEARSLLYEARAGELAQLGIQQITVSEEPADVDTAVPPLPPPPPRTRPTDRTDRIGTGLSASREHFVSLIRWVRQLGGTHQSRLRCARAVLRRVAGQLGALAKSARGQDNVLFGCIISFMNLLADLAVRDGVIPPIASKEFLDELLNDWQGKCLTRKGTSALVLRGPKIRRNDPRPAGRVGVSMISLWRFQQSHGAKYGHTGSRADRDKIWNDAKSGLLALPYDALDLDGANHCVWFVDEEKLSASTGGGGKPGQIHANRAYDLLGLDWRDKRQWENPGAAEYRAKALLLRCPVERRGEAERGLRVPTAVDAWGSMLWAPREKLYDRPWPDGGGRTVNPENGREGLPEGIHGPLTYESSYHEAPLQPIGEVSGRGRADRVGGCGRAVTRRTVKRLKVAIGTPRSPDNGGVAKT